MSSFKYSAETPFWYFLARRAAGDAESALLLVFERLNARASQLTLPITYKVPHATAWAVVCRLFNITHPRAGLFGRMGFSVMQIGFGRALAPKGFAETAFKRLLGNIGEPAFPGRSRDESVVDTFLANGLKLVDEGKVDPSLDQVIVSEVLRDDMMLSLGREACTPSVELWDSAVNDTRDLKRVRRP